MKRPLIEDVLREQSELEHILLPELEMRLKDNIYYRYFKEYEGDLGLIEVTGTNHFHILNFIISLENDNRWNVHLQDYVYELESIFMPFSSLTKTNGMEENIQAHKEFYTVLKEVIEEHSKYFITNPRRLDTYFDCCDLLFKLKRRVEVLVGSSVYWGSSTVNPNLYLYIPLSDTRLTIPVNIVDQSLIERNEIVIPYMYAQDNDSTLDSYFNILTNRLKNAQLQKVFSENKTESVEKAFNTYIIRNASDVFRDYKNVNFDFAAEFRKSNSSVDLLEIIHSSHTLLLRKELLESPTEITGVMKGNTYVLKTESGLYYLKDDKITLGYQTLEETYKL